MIRKPRASAQRSERDDTFEPDGNTEFLLVGLAATLGTMVIHGLVVHTIIIEMRRDLQRGRLGVRLLVKFDICNRHNVARARRRGAQVNPNQPGFFEEGRAGACEEIDTVSVSDCPRRFAMQIIGAYPEDRLC
jgi:hypothetical protein